MLFESAKAMPGVEIYFSLFSHEESARTKVWVPSLWQPISVIRRLIEANVKNTLGCQFDSTRLFFNGCELNDEYTLHHYDIGEGHVIQVTLLNNVICEELYEISSKQLQVQVEDFNKDCKNNDTIQDAYYKVGDYVDAWDIDSGAWFPGRIDLIRIGPSGSIYHIRFDKPSLGLSVPLELSRIRPPAYRIVEENDLCPGEMVLAIGSKKGLWYVAGIETIRISPRGRSVQVTLALVTGNAKDSNMTVVQHVTLFQKGYLYWLEKNITRENRDETMERVIREGPTTKRFVEPDCVKCMDDPNRVCDECGCQKCSKKDQPDRQLICDECDRAVHLWCLQIPLENIPQDEYWYCDQCRNQTQQELSQIRLQYLEKKKQCLILKSKKKLGNKITNNCTFSYVEDIHSNGTNSVPTNPKADSEIIKPKLEIKKVKSKNLISNPTSSKWGVGMACASRSSKNSNIKPIFGAIASIPVGTWWRFRVQASEAGVHAPLVTGIHGKQNLGAYSICFSHNNPEDIDLGDELYYSASGGKLSGKRSGQLAKDQELKKGNKALAMSCNAAFDGTRGANAGINWRDGKPVRVLRSGNGRQSTFSSIYLPKIGVRYDGIYKVVRYWSENDQHRRWVFHLRRDDPTPAPWTEAGRNWARRLDLHLIYPSGWCLEIGDKRTRQRDLKQLNRKGPQRNKRLKENHHNSKKQIQFKLSDDIRELVQKDVLNAKNWNSLLEIKNDKKDFDHQLRKTFGCAICLDLVENPITTCCGHNFCLECFNQTLHSKIDVNKCPICRTVLNMSQHKPNTILHQILQTLVDKRPIQN